MGVSVCLCVFFCVELGVFLLERFNRKLGCHTGSFWGVADVRLCPQ